VRAELLRLDLRDLVGEVRMRPLRELTRRARWPYALYRTSRIPQTFSEIIARRGKPAHPAMGDMSPELACAAVDVASQRLLAYSSRTHPGLPVEHVIRVATAVPSYFAPMAEDERSEIVDAAMTTYSPIWLATGLGDDLPVVVLRAPVPARRARRTMFPTWIGDVLQSGIASQDAYVLERSRRVRVVDVPTEVEAFDFGLSRQEHPPASASRSPSTSRPS
jgi:predicted acylesterase/phospholipase RssA